MPLLPDLYVKDFLLWIFPVVCGWLQFILFFEWHAIVNDSVWNLSLKTLHWNIFPGNQFCSFGFFTKIIFVFASEFFKFKSKDFIQGDYKSIKNLKKNRKYCFFNISQDIWNSSNQCKKLFQETEKDNITFCFLIFLFIITETKIHSKLWKKCMVFQLLFHLVITLHPCYFWKLWVLQLPHSMTLNWKLT